MKAKILILFLILFGSFGSASFAKEKSYQDIETDLQPLLNRQTTTRILIGPHAQPIVDSLTKRIFESQTAKSTFCFLGTTSAKDFSHFLGVSKSLARHLKDQCSSFPATKLQQSVLYSMKSSILGESSFQRPKKYVIALTNEIPKIEGFSTKSGTTLILVNENEANESHLIRILAHELAVSFDQLSGFTSRYPSDSWESGLEMLFPEFKIGQIFHPPNEVQELRCALRDPAIRYAAATERAFRFEDKIMKDLNLLEESPPLSSLESCARTLALRAVQISSITKAIHWETDIGTYTECGVGVLNDPNRRQTLVDHIQRIANTRLSFKATGTSTTLCSLIFEPRVGARRPDNLRHAGPRPRIGGW